MPDCVDRRAGIAAQLQALGLSFEFVDAIRGSTLSAEQRAAVLAPAASVQTHLGRALLDSEIGCVLSHQKAYALLQASGAEQALILEDDALLLPGFADAIAAAETLDIDMLILGYPKLSPQEVRLAWLFDPIKPLAALGRLHHYGLTPRNGNLGTVGYVISRAASVQLHALNFPVRTVADDHPYYAQHLRLVHLRPYAVTEDLVYESTIRGGFRKNRFGLSTKQIVGRVVKGIIRHLSLLTLKEHRQTP